MTGKEIMDRIAENIAALYGATSLSWEIQSDGNIRFISEGYENEVYECVLSPADLQEFNY